MARHPHSPCFPVCIERLASTPALHYDLTSVASNSESELGARQVWYLHAVDVVKKIKTQVADLGRMAITIPLGQA